MSEEFPLGPRLAGISLKGSKCIIWPGAVRDGYGVKKVGSTTMPAHKFVLEQTTGKKVPKGMAVDHLCRNRRCINPKHLEVVSHSSNKERAWAYKLGKYKHKYYAGEPVSKLSAETKAREEIAKVAAARRRGNPEDTPRFVWRYQ
jgi:hypothetical protein